MSLALVDAGVASASQPSISGTQASHITSTNATLEAEIDPQGASAEVFYQFQLLLDPGEAPTEIACPPSVRPYPTCEGPQDPDALPINWITGRQKVRLDLSGAGVSLDPGRTYYFRVLAADRVFEEDEVKWEAPAAVGPVKSFTAPGPRSEPLSMTFTEDRANVGVQLSDAAMFVAPDTAPLTAQIDPGTGSITAGVLEVPDFFTHITAPLDADVLVHFEIGIVEGSFDQTTGALTLEGEANATLTSEEKECTVTTTPNPLVLSTAGNSGGSNPRSGAPFVNGLTGAGTIAGQWTDMDATPKIPGVGVAVCATVDERIEGPGGIWLVQEGDVMPPTAPQLTGTDPASPGSTGVPRILGTAEANSTVRVYAGAGCAGTTLATASASQLASPGVAIQVAEGVTASFSATATDAAGNTSSCSAPISYTRLKGGGQPPTSECIVPKLAGKTLAQAKAALSAADCKLGAVRKPKRPKGRKHRLLVVKSSKPGAGAILAIDGKVDLKLGPKPRKKRR
jgi:hypothetical protein